MGERTAKGMDGMVRGDGILVAGGLSRGSNRGPLAGSVIAHNRDHEENKANDNEGDVAQVEGLRLLVDYKVGGGHVC